MKGCALKLVLCFFIVGFNYCIALIWGGWTLSP